jgi:hypothetical protein
MKFEITAEEQQRIHHWKITEVYPDIIAKQKEDESLAGLQVARDYWDQGYPYGGAIAGDTTYKFSPTSMGLVTEVECWGKVFNLTDYESW